MKITNSRPVPMADVLEVLQERKDAGEELGYEQANALEHAANFAKTDRKKAEAILKKVKAASPKIDEETAVKIIDIMPGNEAALKAVLLKNKIEISDEEIKDVLKALG
ncbi:MAG: hypothetical protein PHQ80_03570 [Candidatus ainarchaeum sp.]|nr:hypothetical protein [Candidatus ainarchaeum sp.]MDD5096389.1 hypothetical protein [Candidatus ainarchaeum sp.]